MPPKGKRKRHSTGQVKETEKRLRLSVEDAKLNARQLREQREMARIQILEQQNPVSISEVGVEEDISKHNDETITCRSEDDDEDFFKKLELLDQSLQSSRMHRYEHVQGRAAPCPKLSPTSLSSVIAGNEVGPFSRPPPKASTRPRRASHDSDQTTHPPESKYNTKSHQSIGLITPPSRDAVQCSLAGSRTTNGVTVQCPPPLSPDTQPVPWYEHNRRYFNVVLCLLLGIALMGIIAMEYNGTALWAAADSASIGTLVTAVTARLVPIGICALGLVLVGAVTYGFICAYRYRLRERAKRDELVASLAADAKRILREEVMEPSAGCLVYLCSA